MKKNRIMRNFNIKHINHFVLKVNVQNQSAPKKRGRKPKKSKQENCVSVTPPPVFKSTIASEKWIENVSRNLGKQLPYEADATNLPMFCMAKTARDSYNVRPCSWEEVVKEMQDPQLQETAKKLLALPTDDPAYREKKNELKMNCKVITTNAQYFLKNHRTAMNAISNGLTQMDLDDLSQEEQTQLASILQDSDFCRSNGIVLASFSISGKGIWLLIKRKDHEWVWKSQCRVMNELEKKVPSLHGKLDEACKDACRVRFLSPYNYLIYADESSLRFADLAAAQQAANMGFGEIYYDKTEPKAIAKPRHTESSTHKNPEVYTETSTVDIPEKARRILRNYINRQDMTQVSEGNRHNTYLRMCVRAFHILYDPEYIFSKLPRFGLPDGECEKIVQWCVTCGINPSQR